MDHRPLAPCRGAKAECRGTDRRGRQATVQPDVTAAKRAGFDDLGDALRLSARHHKLQEQPDEEAAHGRHEHHVPPGKV